LRETHTVHFYKLSTISPSYKHIVDSEGPRNSKSKNWYI